jgi:hypothetical protein
LRGVAVADGVAFWPSAGFWYLKSIFELPDEPGSFSGALLAGAVLPLLVPALLFCRSRCVSCVVVFEVLAAAFGVATAALR